MKAKAVGLIGMIACGLWLGSDWNAEAADDTRLVTAAAEQDWAAVRSFLEDGVDVRASRADGATALLWAAHWNQGDVADRLLRAGADVNAADDYGVTPLARAAENASPAMVERLLAAGADPNLAQRSGLTPVMTAAGTGNELVVRALVRDGADVNARTTDTKATALMWAIAARHPAIVRLLIESGADVKASTTKGYTALLYAAGNGDIDLAKQLLAAGVSADGRGNDGPHALPFAIAAGQVEFALFLIERGADPNGAWMNGVTALHAAAGDLEIWLRDWNRQQGPDAVRGSITLSDRLRLVNALLERGADPNARTTTPAVIMAYIATPRRGAFHAFACGAGNLRGATPLWVAAYSTSGPQSHYLSGLPLPESSADIVRALLRAGADPNLTTVDGTPPLMAAAGIGRGMYKPELVRGDRAPEAEGAVLALLEAGVDVNAANEAEFTALHGAAQRGFNEVIQILVEHGADIDKRDYRGRTAYRLAEGGKQSFHFQAFPETAELLKQLGADTTLGIPGLRQERARALAEEFATLVEGRRQQ